ncbi:MAG TPA: undecaprenyl-diphosphate phosphatase [Steroidobacteraceae bacterium]|jgi:undecaprenyl-diphosphatase|nr:undecaprenyl-diphosphate phosphatase [Steroidobacteraceae bacterium]
MQIWQLIILSVVQGIAELLPISSSAHVIITEKLLGLDPTAPQMTLLLVMLHTGTMFAAIVYFWRSWRTTYFSSAGAFRRNALQVVIATLATALVGLLLLELIKHLVAHGRADFEIETLFGNARLMAVALFAAGLLIICSARARSGAAPLTPRRAAWIGMVQGVCLPFRGFSRSGATISTGMLLGLARRSAEEFSFALAVVLTPAVVYQELHRLHKAQALAPQAQSLTHALAPSLLGMLLSFLAGLLALRWLSRWLEQGRWHYFGIYCLAAALVVLWIG